MQVKTDWFPRERDVARFELTPDGQIRVVAEGADHSEMNTPDQSQDNPKEKS